MPVVEWIWLALIFAYGACVGSFLNVVIYRLPRQKSLVFPPSACPSCGNPIRWYDNIPLFSWLMLRARCRFCKAPISIRYFLIELLTAVIFLGVYLWFFKFQNRQMGIAGDFTYQQFFRDGYWLIYLNAMVLIAAFIAASAIDLELWIIPLGICWLVTAVGIAAAALAGFIIEPIRIELFQLFPAVGTKMAAVSFGAFVGLIFSLAGLWTGWIKPSYPMEEGENPTQTDVQYDDRKEILKEIVFLLPVIIGAVVGYFMLGSQTVMSFYHKIMQVYVIKGLISALAGYLIGCTTVWATRIFGTLLFGREAMGLGDVHLMGAAGAVVGPGMVVIAFFIAPFFGLIWALYQWIFKKSRQIPYGPFLSIAVFGVMIFHDWIQNFLTRWFLFKI